MTYQVTFLQEAAKDWRRLDHAAQKRLTPAIDRLTTAPHLYGKPLSGPLHGLRRVRAGDYRIVYRVNDHEKTVEVGVVCHRKDVYQLAKKRHLI